MEVTYQLTESDLKDALGAWRSRRRWFKWLLFVVAFWMVALAAAGVVTYLLRPDPKFLTIFRPFWIVSALWIVWFAFWLRSPARSARKQFSSQPALQSPRTMSANENGVRWRWDGGNADLAWNNFVHFMETPGLFLLLPAPKIFNVVPKRAFGPEELEAFRSLVKRNVRERK
jgi:hypothetical protein